ncbi:MAG: mucoidy inhibitor MuiA family protein [Candidatus Omnitrophota bacterium]
MKKIFSVIVAFGLFFVVATSGFADETTAKSQITAVTVYPDSALLTRVADLQLVAGTHKIIFSDIIPNLDENSLRVAVSDASAVKLFGAEVKKEQLEEVPAERVKEIKAQIQAVRQEMKQLENIKAVLAEDKKFLNSIKLFSEGQIPKDLVTRMPAASDLEATLKFLDAKLRDNFAQDMDAEIKLLDLSKRLDALNRELAEVSGGGAKLKRSIVVELEVLKPAKFNLSISYLVRGASWHPIYDARANFAKAEVELAAYGIIKQNTGEDWKDVELTLSTAKPAIGGRMPYVSPWFLRPLEPVMRKAKALREARDDVQYDAFYKEAKFQTASPAAGVDESVVVEEKGIAVTYKLPRRAAIKSDGTENKLPILSQVLKADFEYSAFPRAVANAYLGSRVKNAEGLQLLAGRVNVFLEGDFVGASSIDNLGPGEEFDLYLGIDENVKVKRELVEQKVDDVLIAGIASPTKRTTYKYKVTVENYKSRKIKVLFFEAMPVSENERIKVKINEVSLEPKEKDWKDRRGVWRWELELAPQAKQEITYAFTVEHPREMTVEGL